MALAAGPLPEKRAWYLPGTLLGMHRVERSLFEHLYPQEFMCTKIVQMSEMIDRTTFSRSVLCKLCKTKQQQGMAVLQEFSSRSREESTAVTFCMMYFYSAPLYLGSSLVPSHSQRKGRESGYTG